MPAIGEPVHPYTSPMHPTTCSAHRHDPDLSATGVSTGAGSGVVTRAAATASHRRLRGPRLAGAAAAAVTGRPACAAVGAAWCSPDVVAIATEAPRTLDPGDADSASCCAAAAILRSTGSFTPASATGLG